MATQTKTIHIVGAGLAGSECAFQLAERGYQVMLYEMRDAVMTPAHKTSFFAELVCSNSLGSTTDYSAPGQLKWEAKKLGSLILSAAENARVPAGMALGVDREVFARSITDQIRKHPRISIVSKLVTDLNEIPRPLVLATGPLTHDKLAQSIREHFGNEFCYFFDAIAPIIDADSIDHDVVWRADRWDKGTQDYLNCPLEKDEYYQLMNEILKARKIESKDFENTPYFEGCMPIEAIVERGIETPRFGPMSPKGLRNPRTDKNAYAVVQLRQENQAGTAYNMVGFQTKMAYPEQTRVFRMIPGLANAEFLKLGSIHRNLYVNSTLQLNPDLSSKKDPQLYLAGQITGVEGYFESTCMGLLVALHLDQKLKDQKFCPPPRETAFGSLLFALTGEEKAQFQPTNINFGLFPPLDETSKIKKDQKREHQLKRAKDSFESWLTSTSS